MARTTWKGIERLAAAIFGAKRHWANAGERMDVDSPHFAVQVKNRRSLSLAELSDLVDEMTVEGIDKGKIPAVVVKYSCGRPTPLLVVMPAEAFQIVTRLYMEFVTGQHVDEDALHLKELPGMRKRVAEFVKKSMAKGRR